MATTINNFIWKMYVYVHLEHVEGINLYYFHCLNKNMLPYLNFSQYIYRMI